VMLFTLPKVNRLVSPTVSVWVSALLVVPGPTEGQSVAHCTGWGLGPHRKSRLKHDPYLSRLKNREFIIKTGERLNFRNVKRKTLGLLRMK